MSNHTPGPWWTVCNHFSRYEIHHAGGQLAGVAKWDDPASPPPIPEMHANARLIAAAPDLLHACRLIIENAPLAADWLERNDIGAYKQVKAAITRATGHD